MLFCVALLLLFLVLSCLTITKHDSLRKTQGYRRKYNFGGKYINLIACKHIAFIYMYVCVCCVYTYIAQHKRRDSCIRSEYSSARVRVYGVWQEKEKRREREKEKEKERKGKRKRKRKRKRGLETLLFLFREYRKIDEGTSILVDVTSAWQIPRYYVGRWMFFQCLNFECRKQILFRDPGVNEYLNINGERR